MPLLGWGLGFYPEEPVDAVMYVPQGTGVMIPVMEDVGVERVLGIVTMFDFHLTRVASYALTEAVEFTFDQQHVEATFAPTTKHNFHRFTGLDGVVKAYVVQQVLRSPHVFQSKQTYRRTDAVQGRSLAPSGLYCHGRCQQSPGRVVRPEFQLRH